MVPRLNRLPHTTRLSHADRITTPYFMMKIQENDLSTSRFGVVVSKKVSKSAVKRNHVRRQLQACFMETLLNLSKNVDILCMVKPFSGEISFDELNKTFQEIAQKKGLLK